MRKIADADELESELRRLLAYAQSDRPSRSRIASELGSLGQRLAGARLANAKTAGDDARAVTDQLFRLKNTKLERLLSDLTSARRLMERIDSAVECDPEQDHAFQSIVQSENALNECLEALQNLFHRMGWR